MCAAIIVNRGLNIIAGRTSSTADAFAALQSMSVDDGTTAFGATDDSLDDAGGAPANEADADFDATPTRSSQTVTHTATFATGVANFTIKRIALHNDTAANVTTTSTTLFGGIDGQSITKSSDFSLEIDVSITYADAS